jgi:hypothetical protein
MTNNENGAADFSLIAPEHLPLESRVVSLAETCISVARESARFRLKSASSTSLPRWCTDAYPDARPFDTNAAARAISGPSETGHALVTTAVEKNRAGERLPGTWIVYAGDDSVGQFVAARHQLLHEPDSWQCAEGAPAGLTVPVADIDLGCQSHSPQRTPEGSTPSTYSGSKLRDENVHYRHLSEAAVPIATVSS